MYEIFLKITGEVQGVGLRFSAQRQAQELKLVGWVRNTADGSVEILAQGERKNLEKFLEWANSGPAFAKINKVEVGWGKATKPHPTFTIRSS